MKVLLLLGALLAVGTAGFASQSFSTDTEMLVNGGMEAPFANGLAQGWVPNCYGSNEVAFAQGWWMMSR